MEKLTGQDENREIAYELSPWENRLNLGEINLMHHLWDQKWSRIVRNKHKTTLPYHYPFLLPWLRFIPL